VRSAEKPSKQFFIEYDNLRARVNLDLPLGDTEADEIHILAPGLGSPEMEGLRKELSALGRAAVSFEQPRRSPFDFRLRDVGCQRTGILREVIKKSMQNSGAEKAVLIPHSTSAVDAATVSGQMGEDFSSVEYMAGSGFSGESYGEFLTRLGFTAPPTAYANCPEVMNLIMDMQRRAMQNPVQFGMETMYAASSDIRDKLYEQNKDGLNIGILQFERDIVYPPKIITPRIGELAVRKYLTAETVHACHGSPLDDPKNTAKILNAILNDRDLNSVNKAA
jgi:hypothetical protein